MQQEKLEFEVLIFRNVRVGATLAVARIPTLPTYLTGDRKGRPYAPCFNFKFQFIESYWSRSTVCLMTGFVTNCQRQLAAKFQFIVQNIY